MVRQSTSPSEEQRQVQALEEPQRLQQSSDVLLALMRRWWVLVWGIIIGAAWGVIATLLMTPMYQASVYLLVVTASPTIENTAAYDYTQAYSRLATIPSVVGPVTSKYGIEPTAQNLQEVVTVEVPPNSPVFQLTVTTPDPEKSTAMVNDLGAKVSSFSTDRLAPGSGYRSIVVSEALIPKAPTSPDPKLNVALGAAVGFFMGGALVLMWEQLLRGLDRQPKLSRRKEK